MTIVKPTPVLPPVPGQPANVRRVHLDYICHLRHLGPTTGTGEETVTLMPTGQHLVNNITYTAANGDQLFVPFDGTATARIKTACSASRASRR